MYFFESRIRYSETDCDGKLSLASLLNYFQDASTFQSEALGVGLDYMDELHMVWVMCSWQIVVNRYPKLCEEVEIGTLPYEFRGFLGHRNFLMRTKEGEQLAVANTLWSLLNIETGKPTMPTEKMLQGYQLEERLPMDYASRKIQIPEGAIRQNDIVIKRHNLDTNHHVNNGQYVDMAMEFLPEDFVIGQMRAEYKKQAFLDDILYPYVAMDEQTCVVNLADAQGKTYSTIEFTRKER